MMACSDGAVLRRHGRHVVGRLDADPARHVARNDGRIAGDVPAHVAGDQPRAQVVVAARRGRDDHADRSCRGRSRRPDRRRRLTTPAPPRQGWLPATNVPPVNVRIAVPPACRLVSARLCAGIRSLPDLARAPSRRMAPGPVAACRCGARHERRRGALPARRRRRRHPHRPGAARHGQRRAAGREGVEHAEEPGARRARRRWRSSSRAASRPARSSSSPTAPPSPPMRCWRCAAPRSGC